jgi:hypothetical protein
MTYYAYANSVMLYGITFWGNLTHSYNIFKIRKRIFGVITKAGNRDYFRLLFKVLNVLPFYSQYVYSKYIFVVKNMDILIQNSYIHSIHIRQGLDLHYPAYKLANVQKRGVSHWV